MTAGRIYLDHAATTPLTPRARTAMAEALARWSNPSSVHSEGRAARAALEEARAHILNGLGAPAGATLVFTSGASEALGIALGRGRAAARMVSAVEHDAVLRVAGDAERLPVNPSGIIDRDAVRQAVGRAQAPALVAVQHVNNETGVVQDIAAIAEIVRQAGGILLCDAAQSAGKLRLPDADMIAVSAHKFGGPPGIGALILKNDRLIEPMGGQERGLRGGTENLPAILGFAAALDGMADWTTATAPLRQRLEQGVASAGGAAIAAAAGRVPWISALHMPGVPAATQLMHFDMAGIAVSAGAACSSGSMKPSHVLAAMGIAPDVLGSVIRVSLSPCTRPQEIDAFLAEWRKLFTKAGPHTI